jgi:hypothetical protein
MVAYLVIQRQKLSDVSKVWTVLSVIVITESTKRSLKTFKNLKCS